MSKMWTNQGGNTIHSISIENTLEKLTTLNMSKIPDNDQTHPSDDLPWAWIEAVSDIVEDNTSLGVNEDNVNTHISIYSPYADLTQLTPWLYLTSEHTVRRYAQNYLQTGNPLGITHVLSTNVMSDIGKTRMNKLVTNAAMKHCAIDAQDEEGYDILGRHWSTCLQFLQSVKEESGKVMVHCMAGINRSGLIACAAIMVLDRVPVLDVVTLVKQKRRRLLSNHSFRCQLCLLAAKEGLLGDEPGQNPNFDERLDDDNT